MKITREKIERITIRFSGAEMREAFGYCADNSYHITSAGAVKIDAVTYDPDKAQLVAERPFTDDTEYNQLVPAAVEE